MKKFNIDITLTWSKAVALLVLIMAFVLDLASDKKGTIFMFSLPFAVVLITGKQVADIYKPNG